MRVIFEVVKGPESQVGRRYVADRPESFVVGKKRNERVQFQIHEDRYLSRYHLILEVSPPLCFLRDLGSTNGTLVNGRKASQAGLHDGDTIRAGQSEILVRVDTSEPDPADSSAPSLEPVGSSAPDPAGRDNWDTLVFDDAPARVAGSPPRCQVCQETSSDSAWKELTATRCLAVVCSQCYEEHEKRKDPDQPIPNYRRLETLSRGALGPVYKARRVSSGKVVILKVLTPQVAAQPRANLLFLRQMILSMRLAHPRIIPVVEMGQAGPNLWIASEYIEGSDARVLAEKHGGVLPTRDAVDIVSQVLDALDYAHGRNLVHRDVKPTNILVSGKPGVYEALLSDLGLMKNMDEAGVSMITREGERRGTEFFMPPEQVLASRFVKPAGDIYSAGATLYWLLSRQYARNFEARDQRGERKDRYLVILEERVVPLRERSPAVPEGVAKVVEKALASDPEDRFETASEMARALKAAMA